MLVRMSSGSNHHGLIIFGAKCCDFGARIMGTEIDDYVSFVDNLGKIISLIDLRGDLQFSVSRSTSQQRPFHAAFGTRNNNFDHSKSGGISARQPALLQTKIRFQVQELSPKKPKGLRPHDP